MIIDGPSFARDRLMFVTIRSMHILTRLSKILGEVHKNNLVVRPSGSVN